MKLLKFPMYNSLYEKMPADLTYLLIEITRLFRPLKEANEIKYTFFFLVILQCKREATKNLLLKKRALIMHYV